MTCKFVLLIIIILPRNYRQSTQWYLKHQLLACSLCYCFSACCQGCKSIFCISFRFSEQNYGKSLLAHGIFPPWSELLNCTVMCYFEKAFQLKMPALKLSEHFLQSGLHKFSTGKSSEIRLAGPECATEQASVLVAVQVAGFQFISALGSETGFSFCFLITIAHTYNPSSEMIWPQGTFAAQQDSHLDPTRGNGWKRYWTCPPCHPISGPQSV